MSDHASFWHHGYRAFMITDTAFYRYPYYHTAKDTPEKLDYSRLAEVTDALAKTFVAIAQPDLRQGAVAADRSHASGRFSGIALL